MIRRIVFKHLKPWSHLHQPLQISSYLFRSTHLTIFYGFSKYFILDRSLQQRQIQLHLKKKNLSSD